MENLFYFLSVLQVLAGVYLIWQGLQWLAYVRRRLHGDPGFYAPRVALLCPCKGMEPSLERNLVALTEFDYQNYDVFFVVASASDAACAIAKRVSSQSRAKAHVIVAGPPQGCAEKVNNLRVAVEQLPAEFEVVVFADSDGRPGKSWLHHLVAPLNDSRIGATTTMRWLIPNHANFASALLAAWNAPVLTMLTENGRNFCWGGGTAIRKSVFDSAGVIEEWRNSASDDFSMTRALERSGRAILFVPECLTPSYVETNFAGLLEFTNRQVLITRVYAEKMWGLAAATHLLFCATLLLGIFVTFANLFAGVPAFQLAALTFLPVLLASIRGAMRLAGVTEALPACRSQIMSQAWIYILLPVLVPFLYVANFAASLVTRKIRWRGVRYELISPQQTRVLSY